MLRAIPRVAAPFTGELYLAKQLIGGVLWSAGFGLRGRDRTCQST